MAETSTSRTLLVPVDDTEENERALEWALENVYRQGDIIHLLHIVPISLFHAVVHHSEQEEQMLVDQAHNWVQERFTHTCEQAAADYKVTVMKGTSDTDSIAQIICHQAEQLGASLVVMAAHNKGRQVKYIVGTVTEYCTHHLGKTVLVMH